MEQAAAKKRSLWDIGEDLVALREVLEAAGGEITEDEAGRTIEAWLEQAQTDLSDKVNAYLSLRAHLNASASAHRERAASLMERARQDEAAVVRLDWRLHNFMKQHEIKRIETPDFVVKRVGNGGQAPVVLKPGAHVPPEYMRQPEPLPAVPDRTKIRAALEQGEILDFATLGERGERLDVR